MAGITWTPRSLLWAALHPVTARRVHRAFTVPHAELELVPTTALAWPAPRPEELVQ